MWYGVHFALKAKVFRLRVQDSRFCGKDKMAKTASSFA